MTPDDVEAVAALERVLYPFPWTAGNFRDALRAGYEVRIHDVSGLVRIPGPGAYSVCMRVLDETHLLNLSVHPAWQRQGVGEAVLRWLAATAATDGATSMWLEVRPSNQTAIRLYSRCGFMAVGRRRDYYPAAGGTHEDAILMRCALGEAAHAGRRG